ncbi:hypothetical protein CONLIGDRAFT_61992 [Coniochaeta ligniaria NRRL 30616]|uniref:Uncharacterized protein n=1 Tax=Coniochaeta ligniaria NRRL 30616 TaxID=1408157 RepID=A0A1J7J7T6_9PEZI|nr:hypothetical protein CONLIGDRAFT_61992 [Coniochaeta ligniaria NRRL 30616]
MATPLPDADFGWKPCQGCPEGSQGTSLPSDSYRGLIKDRMRLSFRIAATNNHVHLVLGVLGNPARPWFTPAEDMAWCCLEVLREWEFNSKAQWWELVEECRCCCV